MKPLFISFMIFATACHSFAEDFSECFVPGEVSEYKVSWARIPIGWSRSSTETLTEEGRELIRIRMETRTYSSYDTFFKVNNVMSVVVDPKTALPVRLDLVQHQGDAHKSRLTLFDHAAQKAISIDRLNQSTNTVSILPNTREMLSLIYASRKMPIDQLPEETFPLLSNGEHYDIRLTIKDTGKVRLSEYGRVASVELDPIADREGAELTDEKTTFWVSKESRRMITCVETKVPIGKVRVKLKTVSGPGNDFWVQKEEDE